MILTNITLENHRNIHHYDFKQLVYQSHDNYELNTQYYYDEIYIQGIKNKKLLNQIKKFFKLDVLLNSSRKITRYEISSLLYKMKISGFFTKLKLISVKIHGKQKIIIHVSPNIIFSKIEVLSNNKATIPYKYIKKLFQRQIGYPQSLHQLNTALHKLTTWYHLQGYYYTIAQIIRSQVNPEYIILNISEGVIDKIDFIFMPPYQNILLTSINIYITLIQRLLGINIKNTLNIKHLDLRIQYLKEQEILKNCSYTIKYVDKKQDHLEIKIYLFFSPSKMLNLLLEQFHHPFNTKKVGKHLANHCFTQHFYNYYNKYIFYNSLRYRSIYQCSKLKQLFCIPIYTTCKQQKVTPNVSNHQDLFNLIDYYTQNLLTSPKSIWQIHQHITSPTYFNYSMNLKFSQQSLILELRCTKPWISIETNTIGTVYCHIVKSIFFTCTKTINQDLNPSEYNSLQYTRYFIDFSRIEIGLIYKLAEEIVIKKLLGKYKIFCYDQLSQIYLRNNYFLQNIKKHSIKKFSTLSKIIKQNYIYCKCEYLYNTEDKLEETPKGWSVEALHTTYMQVWYNTNTIFNKIYINHAHLIRFKYLHHYQVLTSHSLINKLDFLITLGNNIISSLVKHVNKTNNMLAVNNSFQLTELIKKLWTATSEYHYIFNTTYSGFIFMHYGQNIENNVYFYVPSSLLTIIPMIGSENRYSFSVGLGMQIKNSIKKIDLIRLEYLINKHSNSQFYIKILGQQKS